MNPETGNVPVLDVNTVLLEPIRQNIGKIASFLPNIIDALYILVFGWILAFAAKWISRSFLKFINFDKIAEKTGIAAALNDNGIGTNPAEWFSRLFYWIVMIAVFIRMLFKLRLDEAASGLDLFSGFIFQSLGLLFIFIIGLFMSIVLSRIVYATSANLKVKSPAVYSRVMKWAVLAFTLLLVLRQIALPINFFFMVAGAIFVSVCIAFIIAFGIGGSGWAAKMLEKISK